MIIQRRPTDRLNTFRAISKTEASRKGRSIPLLINKGIRSADGNKGKSYPGSCNAKPFLLCSGQNPRCCFPRASGKGQPLPAATSQLMEGPSQSHNPDTRELFKRRTL